MLTVHVYSCVTRLCLRCNVCLCVQSCSEMMEGLGLQAVALSDGSTAYIQQTISGETISWKYAHSISIITSAVTNNCD